MARITQYFAGMTKPDLPIEIEGRNLTGHTVKVYLEQPDGTVISRTATLTDPTNGVCQIDTWQTTDFVAGNGQQAQLEDDDGSGGKQRWAIGEFDVPAILS